MSELLFDPQAAIAELKARDRKLAKVIDRSPVFGVQPQKLTTPFEALAKAIVYQQLSGKAAGTIFERVRKLVTPSGRRMQPAHLAPATDDDLRACGLSRAKLAALRDLAAKSLEGHVPTLKQLHAMEDDAIVERLTAIRGIGRWTVEMLLIFRLGRPDVLPVTDYGVRKGFQLTYGGDDLPSHRDLLAFGERWRPFRSVASWYLWRALDLKK
jgi:3-methyladenine DNA glycosylase/8-oxoguanine DNA glycosylase